MLTLEEFTAPLLAKVPIDPEVSMVFTRRNCPAPPAELETDQLLIKTHPLSSRYGASVWRDDVRFFAEKPTLRSLGLLTLSHVLHPDRETVIHVRHLPNGTYRELKSASRTLDGMVTPPILQF